MLSPADSTGGEAVEALAFVPNNRLEWSVHLLKRNSGAIPLLAIAVLCAGLLVTLLFHSPIPGLVAMFLLIASVKEYLFPCRYVITDKGVEFYAVGTAMELAWKDVRRCEVESRQITLTSLKDRGPLDAFRGITLRFAVAGSPGDRDAVLAFCRANLAHLNGLEDAAD